MAMNIHQEARRRQMHMDRVCEARRRMMLDQQEGQECPEIRTAKPADSVTCTDQGQFYQTRMSLLPFRVNLEGHRNRYRNRQHFAPHRDRAYTIIYPGRDNSDYTVPDTRKNRRENTFVSVYEITRKVNGEFRLPVPLRAMSSNIDTRTKFIGV